MSYLFIESQRTDLVKHHSPFNMDEFKNAHVVFSGVLGNHPSDPNKIVLISDPHINNTSYYEFESADIGLIEKLPNIINSDGEDAAMALLWIKKGSCVAKSSIFMV